MDMSNNEIVRLGLDVYHNTAAAPAEYADKRPVEVLRQALIDLNGGSTQFNYKTLRRRKPEFFEILEEIITIQKNEGLQGDEFWNAYVEDRNVAEGDKNEFSIEDDTTFVVSEMADGIAIPRRQRLGETRKVSIPTTVHGIRIYDEMSRFMAGRIDWNDALDKVSRAYTADKLNRIYKLFASITADTAGLNDTYVTGGTYNEENLLKLVEHVESATGLTARIVGTKPALRKCTTAVVADAAKNDYYNLGHYGRLAGVDMVALKNRHAVGTDNFILPDDKLWVIASNDKFIKSVTEGEPLILEKEATDNSDLTMEYLYTEKSGEGLIIANKMGIYTIA